MVVEAVEGVELVVEGAVNRGVTTGKEVAAAEVEGAVISGVMTGGGSWVPHPPAIAPLKDLRG